VSMRTGRLSVLSAEHDVRYTGNERFFVIRVFKASGGGEGFYGLVDGVSGPKI